MRTPTAELEDGRRAVRMQLAQRTKRTRPFATVPPMLKPSREIRVAKLSTSRKSSSTYSMRSICSTAMWSSGCRLSCNVSTATSASPIPGSGLNRAISQQLIVNYCDMKRLKRTSCGDGGIRAIIVLIRVPSDAFLPHSWRRHHEHRQSWGCVQGDPDHRTATQLSSAGSPKFGGKSQIALSSGHE
jgi:hypothetical protein